MTSLVGCNEPPPPQAPPAAQSVPPAPVAAAHATIDAAAERAAATIGGEQIRAVIAEIADDRYEGRSPGSAGDMMARAYLAAQLQRLGFESGPGGWEQPVELVGVDADAPPTWRFSRGDQTIDLAQRAPDILAQPATLLALAFIVAILLAVAAAMRGRRVEPAKTLKEADEEEAEEIQDHRVGKGPGGLNKI